MERSALTLGEAVENTEVTVAGFPSVPSPVAVAV
jgi:hypothetical protein